MQTHQYSLKKDLSNLSEKGIYITTMPVNDEGPGSLYRLQLTQPCLQVFQLLLLLLACCFSFLVFITGVCVQQSSRYAAKAQFFFIWKELDKACASNDSVDSWASCACLRPLLLWVKKKRLYPLRMLNQTFCAHHFWQRYGAHFVLARRSFASYLPHDTVQSK